jgi:hypothetical protein
MVKGGYLVADPTKIPNRKVGDRLRFDSEYGKFEVKFNRWIFSGRAHPITDRRARTIRKTGEYKVECSITPADTSAYPSGKPVIYPKGKGAHGNVTG